MSLATGDIRSAGVMAAMVALGVGLRFTQESRADRAAAALRAMIHVTAAVIRNGHAQEIPLSGIVPGDLVLLAAGDMVPGDARVLAAKDLFCSQASLTGESLPVEKTRGLGRRRTNGLSMPRTCSFWGRACRAARPRLSWLRPAHGRYLARWPKRSPRPEGDRLRSGDQAVYLADDPVHGGDGAAGFPDQWPDEARLEAGLLLRAGGGRRPDAGNAADDRLRLPLQGRAGDVARKKSSSNASIPSRTSAPWTCSARTRPARSPWTTSSWKSIATSSRTRATTFCGRLSHQPFPDRLEKCAGPRRS